MDQKAQDAITSGNAALGIEFGSTRIKAVLIGPDQQPLATGGHEWRSRLEDGHWTYDLDAVWSGVQAAYAELAAAVREDHGVELTTVGAMGFSAMMHGYLAFDAAGELMVPFRTWQNTSTGQAAGELTQLFQHNIPQRWSIAHLYQAILNGEEHVGQVAHFTTLAGYVHWKLTGETVLGVGDASGMFPIDVATGQFDTGMIAQFDELVAGRGYGWKLADLLPAVLPAGAQAGSLTAAGAKLLDPTGVLQPGIPLAPAEGDAGTGMVATNSVARRTAVTTSRCCRSTSSPVTRRSPGTRKMFNSIADAPASPSCRAISIQPPSDEPLMLAITGTSTAWAARRTRST